MRYASLAPVLAVTALALGAAAAYTVGAARAGPSDDAGYAGKGQIVAQTTLGGAKLTVGGDVALEERGGKLRLDVLSVAIPGADAALSSLLATQLFPPGGFTVVYDRAAAGYIVWSNAKRAYFASGAVTPPRGGSGPSTGPERDLFAVLAPLRSMKDAAAFTASVSLAGHGPVNGHPATGLNFQLSRSAKSGDATSVHGTVQLADDLDAVPVQVTAAGKSPSIPESAVRLDVTTLSKRSLPASDFEVPAGYARTSDVAGVVGNVLPH